MKPVTMYYYAKQLISDFKIFCFKIRILFIILLLINKYFEFEIYLIKICNYLANFANLIVFESNDKYFAHRFILFVILVFTWR